MHNDSPSLHPTALLQPLAALSRLGVIPRTGRILEAGAAEVAERLRQAVVAEIPAFTASGNPDVLPELAQHAEAHIAELRRLLGGGAAGDFAFVRDHIRRRAAQRFPLEAMLHAYRCGLTILSRWLRAAAVEASPRRRDQVSAAIADFAIEYTNQISIVAAVEYVAQTRVLAETEGDQRTELLRVLLQGYDEADGRIARLLKRAGYLDQRLSFCVARAQSTDPLEMENPARAQRLAEAMAQAVAAHAIRVLVGVRDHVVTAVYSAPRRASGWTAPQAGLAERICPALLLLGPSVLVGLSSDQPSTSFVPRGLHEANVALDFATVTERVVPFFRLPLRRLLIHRGADYVQPALPPWFARWRDANTKSGGALAQTLRALADADMNVQAAARRLKLHPNTVYARLTRLQDLTGLDGQRYHALTELLLAIDCARP